MPVAGQPYTITCSTNDSSSDLMWLSPAGEELQSGDGIIVGDIKTEGGVTRRTLMFSSLEVSDSGEYTCQSDTDRESIILQIEGNAIILIIMLLTVVSVKLQNSSPLQRLTSSLHQRGQLLDSHMFLGVM